MKYDYDRLSTEDILEIYYDVFGDDYFFSYPDADIESKREDVIRCIENGTPQEYESAGVSDHLRGLVAGVDYLL